MIFTPPTSLPALPSPLPLQDLAGEFALETHLHKTKQSNKAHSSATWTDAATNQTWTTDAIIARVGEVATALSVAWRIKPGQKWHKIVGLLTSNYADALILSWAIHRLGGGCLMLQPTSSADEIAGHLDRVPPCALFASEDLLSLGKDAVQRSSMASKLQLYRLSLPTADSKLFQESSEISSLEDLLMASKNLPATPKSTLSADEAAHRVAYCCTTSGTGGLQRVVAMTHKNVVACMLQVSQFYTATRGSGPETHLGFLPFNHIYGLLIIHSMLHLGDSVVIHRGFNLMEVLTSIGKNRINNLFLVPPIINAMSRNAAILSKFDLSSVTSITSGGGPLKKEDFMKMQVAQPNWRILSGWGQTEGCGVGTLSGVNDIFPGSSGPLLPGVRIRLRDDDGREVESLEEMGEIEIASPSILSGYIDHADDAILTSANDADFWWSTGDVGLFRKSPSGQPHLFVVDRIRDMIKVKGNQVAPGQIEAHLSQHAAVAENAVIGVADEIAGERALAFVVRDPTYAPNESEAQLRQIIRDHNDLILPEVCRLQDRILFVDAIPKSASGKVLKRELRKQVAT
ncbi:hypothetical protein M409DRAFT_38360 [Zasmidium cellare ATCC 36951]|uniref:AMP-dependent synthetase/ligase domain-containing protein n=1 Tax=Zasmidium cellare ATCC 36951 TaxID=1080233 RepID=A0A6A6BWE6_ZASCE|nr:uncharacterized protein M409DRAFT_38360 [Zasmidium cellare ATCC 36951]KAF2158300.1 hypothetical protein M409DRAFT_38360 [Zasmidium cellare ATCC 36951]